MGLKRKPTLHYKLSVITWAEEVGGGVHVGGEQNTKDVEKKKKWDEEQSHKI